VGQLAGTPNYVKELVNAVAADGFSSGGSGGGADFELDFDGFGSDLNG
jgi:hypothetical protein